MYNISTSCICVGGANFVCYLISSLFFFMTNYNNDSIHLYRLLGVSFVIYMRNSKLQKKSWSFAVNVIIIIAHSTHNRWDHLVFCLHAIFGFFIVKTNKNGKNELEMRYIHSISLNGILVYLVSFSFVFYLSFYT